MGRKPARAAAPFLSVCMIVRNEEANLPRALRSVKGVADELVIVDTGSTDRTVEVARSFGARVFSRPWTGDFAAARNAGLDEAQGEWIMMLDADEELMADDGSKVGPLLKAGEADGFICTIISFRDGGDGPDFTRTAAVRLWRNHPAHRYAGVIHEQIAPSILGRGAGSRLADAPVRFAHYGYLRAAAETKKDRNLNLTLRAVELDPEAHYYRYYLGIEYQMQNRMEEALEQYRLAKAGAAGTPWEPALFRTIVHCLLLQQRWDEAAAELAVALQRYPDFTDLLYFRGILEHSRGEHVRAVATFSQCAAMGPAPVPPYATAEEGLGSWKAFYALGQAYQGAGRLHDAVGAYEQAGSLQPGWFPPLQSTVNVLLGAGVEPAKVAQYLDERLPRSMANRPLALADMLCQGGAPHLALEAIPGSVEGEAAGWATYLRGCCHLKLEHWDEAASALAAVPPGDSRRPAAMAALAFCRWCQGREDEMQAALAEVGDDAGARAHGAALFVEAARSALAKGLSRFPDSAPLRDLAERVRRELS